MAKLGIFRTCLISLLSLQLAAQPVLASFRSAGNDLSVEAGENYQSHEYHRSETKKSWGGLKKKTTTTDHFEERLTHTASTLQGKGGVSLEAGNDTTLVGSKLQSGGNLDITTGGELAILAAEDKHIVQHDQKSKSSFLGINYGKSTSSTRSTQTQASGSVSEAMGDMATTSGGSSTFQASQFQAGGNITLKAGVDKDGNILDPNAKIYFATAQEYTAYREELYKTNGLWFVQSDQGKEETTAAYNQFDSKNLKVEATGGIIADVGVNTSNGETAAQVIGKLATQPGMEWLADLQKQSQDPNNPTPVQWQQVETAFRDWDYKQEGLTPQAAALISIAVAIATNGMGANLVGSAFNTQIQNAALQSALNAGFTTLSQQAAVTLINNKGDLGKTLKQLGSSDSLKSLATSMVTAGLSSQLSHNFHLTGSNLTLAQQFQQKALNGLVSATVSTAIEGGNFDDKLKAALKTATLDTLNQLGAQKVGDLLGSGQHGYLAHKIAHTALGCAVGAATNDDCESAAIGGLVGSIAGDHYNSEQAATLTAAIVATLLGKDVNLAANVGTIADKFNRQLHQSEVDWVKEKAKKLAKEKGISEAEALKLLMLEAVQLADYTYEQVLPDNPEIRSWLETQATQDGQFQKQRNLIGLETTVDGYFDSSINRDVVSQNAGLYLATIGLSPERAATINRQNVMGEWGEGYDDAKAQALLDRYQTVAEFMLPDIMLIPEAYEAYQNGEYGKALLLAGMLSLDAYTPGKLPLSELVKREGELVTRMVAEDAKAITDISKKAGKKAVAVSRAVVDGKVTGKYTNIKFDGDNQVNTLADKGLVERIDGESFIIKNEDGYIAELKVAYEKGGKAMDSMTENQIRLYIQNSPVIREIDGLPGAHAEIQAFNEAVSNMRTSGGTVDVSRISVATYKTQQPNINEAFKACQNCCGILPCGVNVTTGKITD